MRRLHNNRHGRQAERVPRRPDTLSLLAHIARAVVADGMLFPAAACIGMLLFAEHNKAPELSGVAIVAMMIVLLIAVLRGCNNWQYDLVEHQRECAIRFKTGDQEMRNSIPGFYTSRH